MTPRVILITGATDGLGRAVASRLASDGMTILVHGRSPQRCRETAAEIALRHPGAVIRTYVADFTRLADVFRLILEVRAQEPRIDVLINNAGVGVEPQRETTADGYEKVFQVNYLATYALSVGLAPVMARSRGRIICVSSSSQAPLDFQDPHYCRDWNGAESYGRSKWAQAAFVSASATLPWAQSLTLHALHPGAFMPTKLVLNRFPVVDDLSVGVDALWSLAIRDEARSVNGLYFDRRVASSAHPSAYDAAVQEKLLAMSECLLETASAGSGLSWAEMRKP